MLPARERLYDDDYIETPDREERFRWSIIEDVFVKFSYSKLSGGPVYPQNSIELLMISSRGFREACALFVFVFFRRFLYCLSIYTDSAR